MEQFIQRCIDGLKSVKFFREGRFGQFLISVLAELQKVTWPSKDDVKNSTVITLVVMIVMSLYMGGAQAVVSFIYDTIKDLVT